MIIGTAGHIDHGKTSLVRVLTGVDTDRLKEEKRRGMSIELGFAYMPAPDGSIVGFIDVPGHERFVHTMVAGASGIDFVVLVIAADDGVMPQTLEHLAIVDILGIARGVVALTKADLVTPARREEVAREVARVLSTTALAGAPIIALSSLTGEGVDELRRYLLEAASAFGRRAARGQFRLAVDRSFTLAGAGTIVTGTVLSGRVAVGDQVVVSPAGLAARVRSIHAQNRPAERGHAGERCALNLVGADVSKEAIRRGDVVVASELHAPADRIDARVRLLAGEARPVPQWMPVRLHHAAAEVGARVALLEEEALAPGTSRRVQLVLERPIAAAVGDRFVLRDTTAQRTIAGGRFLDLRGPSRKRRTAIRMAQLDALAIEDPAKSLAALLDCEPRYVDLSAFARDHALAGSEIESIAGKLNVIRIAGKDHVFGLSPASWMCFKRALLSTLKAFHEANTDLPGFGLERLRLQIEPRLPAAAFSAALQGLARVGEVALDGAWVKLAGHEVRLTPQDARLWQRMMRLLGGDERFRPPRVRDIGRMLDVPETGIRRLSKLLARMGKIDEVAHDHFFLRNTVAEMVQIAAELAEAGKKGEFTAAQFRDKVNNGRKVAIQILEFFDHHGVTIRRGDLRRINKHRLDLFRATADSIEPDVSGHGKVSSPAGRPGFQSRKSREAVFDGFDPQSRPPHLGSHR